jgi:chromosome partitioning related protein ParA
VIKFAVMSTKGGVGKTTLAANLGGVLADIGLRVLMVDADVQPSLSKYFKVEKRAPNGLSYVIRKQAVTEDCVSRTIYPNLDIIVSDDDEGVLQPWLASKISSHEYLANALASPLITDEHYDCVIIDTQGAMGPLQNNAGLAATQLLLPVVPEVIAAREFISGTMSLIAQLEPRVEFKGRAGQVKGILYKMDRTTDARVIADDLRKAFISLEGRVSMLKTHVPAAKAYKEAATSQIPVHLHEPSREGGTMLSAFEVMHQIAWELIPSLDGVYAKGHNPNDPSLAVNATSMEQNHA